MERHPKSAPGDFYVLKGECLSCGVPEAVAPELVGWIDEKQSHCYWKKQPETLEEIDHALAVLTGQELYYHRYAGRDPAILRRVSDSLFVTLLLRLSLTRLVTLDLDFFWLMVVHPSLQQF